MNYKTPWHIRGLMRPAINKNTWQYNRQKEQKDHCKIQYLILKAHCIKISSDKTHSTKKFSLKTMQIGSVHKEATKLVIKKKK